MGDVRNITDELRRDGELSEYVAGVLERSPASDQALSLESLSVRYVRAVVAAVRGNKSHAARVLGVSRRSLYRWLEREAA